jgi:hypothetical protein
MKNASIFERALALEDRERVLVRLARVEDHGQADLARQAQLLREHTLLNLAR